MCQEVEIPSTNILHTNTFAVWLHYSLCHVQPTVVMPALCLSLSLTFISVLTWTLATWPLPLLDKAMPTWRAILGLALGRAVSLYKCAFISAAALGLSVGADVVFSVLVSNNYTVFLKKYADEQSKKSGSAFAHSSSSSLGYFIAIITSGSTAATTRHRLPTPIPPLGCTRSFLMRACPPCSASLSLRCRPGRASHTPPQPMPPRLHRTIIHSKATFGCFRARCNTPLVNSS